MEQWISRFRIWIQGMGKHKMFWDSNCMVFYLCNIFYHIMEGEKPSASLYELFCLFVLEL